MELIKKNKNIDQYFKEKKELEKNANNYSFIVRTPIFNENMECITFKDIKNDKTYKS